MNTDLSFFNEKEQVIKQIQCLESYLETKLCTDEVEDTNGIEPYKDQVRCMKENLEKYQEKPWLLDASVVELTTRLMNILKKLLKYDQDPKDENNSDRRVLVVRCNSFFNKVSEIMYTLCKVRGYKKIVHHFPHEASDLVPVLSYVKKMVARLHSRRVNAATDAADLNDSIDRSGDLPWQAVYILFLWLSNLCLLPFQLELFDGKRESEENPGVRDTKSTIHSIVLLALESFKDSSPINQAASVCLARLLSRRDVLMGTSGMVVRFVKVGVDAFSALDNKASFSCSEFQVSTVQQEQMCFFLQGIIATLAHLCKLGARSELLQGFSHEEDEMPLDWFGSALFTALNQESICISRAQLIKLMRRISLLLIPPMTIGMKSTGFEKPGAVVPEVTQGQNLVSAALSNGGVLNPELVERFIEAFLYGMCESKIYVITSVSV